MTQHERLSELFKGLDRAHGEFRIDKKLRESDNKVQGSAKTVEGPVTAEHWQAHVDGKYGIGVVPITDDETCHFAAIDFDVYDEYTVKRFVNDAKRSGFPFVWCKSKSGGAHLYMFFAEPIAATDVRKKLGDLARTLGYPKIEIFPKQERLEPGQVGNWINLPYFNAQYTERYAFDDNGQPIADLEAFLDYAEGKVISAEAFKAQEVEAQEIPFSDAPPCIQTMAQAGVGDGERNKSLFQFAVYAKKKHGDEYEEHVLTWNEEYFSPALPIKEIEGTIFKSLADKDDYGYLCNEPVCSECCNKPLCQTREFGIGSNKTSYSQLKEALDVEPLPTDWAQQCRESHLSPVERDLIANHIKKSLPGATLPAIRAEMSPHREAAEEKPLTVAGNTLVIDRNRAGKPLDTVNNLRYWLREIGLVSRLNEFTGQFEVGGVVVKEFAGGLTDSAEVMAKMAVADHTRFNEGESYEFPLTAVHEAIVSEGLLNRYNPVTDYLDQLVWDGVPRLDTWAVNYLGSPDTPLNRAMASITLLAAIRRARRPGCKFDTVLTLEGPQGNGKSTAVQTLAGGNEYFADQDILATDSKQQAELVRGIWLYEIAEMAGKSKAQIDKLKAFITRTVDRCRPAYGRNVEAVARGGIFIATTNNADYLSDSTGNRRWWPIVTTTIDIEALKADRDQLFAEAAHREAAGESLILPEELWADAAVEQDDRMQADPWADVIESKLHNIERASSSYLLRRVLELPIERQTADSAKRVHPIMEKMGWTYSKNVPWNGKRGRGFWRGDKNRGPEDESMTDEAWQGKHDRALAEERKSRADAAIVADEDARGDVPF